MKLIIVLLIAACLQVSAKGYSQKVTLKENNISLQKVFEEIRKQTGYQFLYADETLKTAKKVSVNIEKGSIEEVLKICFKDQQLSYTVSGNTIIVKKSAPDLRSGALSITLSSFSSPTFIKKSEQFIDANEIKGKFITNAIQIKGKVTNPNGEALMGVSVTVKGTSIGTSTDSRGMYFITVPNVNNTLIFSYVGFTTIEVPVNNRTEIDVVLEIEATGLSDVVVVGYGTQKKESVVGSIARISGSDLKNGGMVSNISDALKGQIPGVTVIGSSGEPGRDIPDILIRGQSTWNNARPLILVDGVERQMNDINVNDISSISVLKDASATAVFGVKGANGVILITTKRGNLGKPRLSFSAHQSLEAPSKLLTLMDATAAEEWKNAAVAHEVSANPSAWQYYLPQQIIDYTKKPQVAPYSYLYPNVDWPSVVLKKFAKSNQADLSLSGGTDFVRYFTSIGYVHDGDLFNTSYNKQRGYDPGFSFDRFNFRGNLDFNLSKSTIFSTNVNGYFGRQKSPGATYGGSSLPGNAQHDFSHYYAGVYTLAPDAFPVTYPNGIYGYDPTNLYNANPMAVLQNSGYEVSNRNHLGTDFKLTQKLDAITKGLSFSARVSFDNYAISDGPGITDGGNQGSVLYQYIDPSILNAKNRTDSLLAITQGTSQTSTGVNQFDWVSTPWRYRSTTYGASNVEAVDNSSVERDIYYEAGLNYDRSFNKNNFSGLFLFSRRQSAVGSEFPHFQEDWVGRITYNYASKYFLEINGAYDGSENFAPKYRFGFFPSAAVGWNISNESFMKQFIWLDMLKLRASVGKVGSDQGIPRWGYISSWVRPGSSSLFSGLNGIPNVPSPYLTYREGTIGNPDLQWETSLKKNIGIDVAAFQNRLTFEGDVFEDRRSNIFMSASQRNIPNTFGAPPVPANLGETDSKGYEVTLGFKDQITKNFGYNISLSMTGTKDIILKYEDPQLLPAYQKTVGLPLGQIKAQVSDGYMNNWDDIYGSVSTNANIQYRLPGDPNIIDYNGDGIIDQFDNVPYGHTSTPQRSYNANLGLNYKNLSLMLQFYAVSDITLYVTSTTPQALRYSTVSKNLANYWTPENTNSFYKAPRLTTSSSGGLFGLTDASYVRLQTARIAYEFTGDWVKKLKVSDARIILSGNNLFFWSKMPYDFDVNFNLGNSYPNMKQYDLSLQFSF